AFLLAARRRLARLPFERVLGQVLAQRRAWAPRWRPGTALQHHLNQRNKFYYSCISKYRNNKNLIYKPIKRLIRIS
ncbi:MAG: hypothetical protein PHS84_08140, partial [Paludibacter sp.]|nr:hypothetical protein [Paludibacter sp.]